MLKDLKEKLFLDILNNLEGAISHIYPTTSAFHTAGQDARHAMSLASQEIIFAKANIKILQELDTEK